AEVIAAVVAAAKAEPDFGVPGMARFKYARETDGTVILTRRNGNEANIAKSTLAIALKGVRADHYLYIGGPGGFSADRSHARQFSHLRLAPPHATKQTH